LHHRYVSNNADKAPSGKKDDFLTHKAKIVNARRSSIMHLRCGVNPKWDNENLRASVVADA
jgi:hypothetical protein